MILLRGGLCSLFFAFLFNTNLKAMEDKKEYLSSDLDISTPKVQIFLPKSIIPKSIDDIPVYYARIANHWQDGIEGLINFGSYNNQYCIEKVITFDDEIDREIHFILYHMAQKRIDITWTLDSKSIKPYLTKRLTSFDMIIRIHCCPDKFHETLSSLATSEILKIQDKIPKKTHANSEQLSRDKGQSTSLNPIEHMLESVNVLTNNAFYFQKPTYNDLKICYENIIKNLQEDWICTSKYVSHSKPSSKWNLFIKKDLKDYRHIINLINLLAEKFGLKESVKCAYTEMFNDANILLWVSKNNYELFHKIFKLKYT